MIAICLLAIRAKVMKLTKHNVDKIMPGEMDAFHWDDELKDLELKVTVVDKKILVLV